MIKKNLVILDLDFCDSNVLARSFEMLLMLAKIFMILLILVRVLLIVLGWIFVLLMIWDMALLKNADFKTWVSKTWVTMFLSTWDSVLATFSLVEQV